MVTDSMRSDRSLAFVLVLMSLAAAACSVSGAPVPGGTPMTSSALVPTSSAASPLPPRPEDVDLAGLDPCSLLTAEQRAQLGLRPEPIGGGASTRATGEISCGYLAAADEPPRIGFHLALATDRDASELLGPDSGGTTWAIAAVGDFPAVQEAGPERSLRPCLFAVSTKDGQYVEVRLDYGSSIQSGVLPLE